MADSIAGQISVAEQPGSPRIRRVGGRREGQRVYKGRYQDLLAKMPNEGDEDPELGNLAVVSSELLPVAGEGAERIGVLTVEYNDDHKTEGVDAEKPIYEVRWLEQQVDVRLHPRYKPDGDDALTLSDLAMLQVWETETNHLLKSSFKFRIMEGEYTLSANAQKVARKILKGVLTYPARVPVARIVSYTLEIPQTNPCDKIQTGKPFDKCPDGYTWVSTADDATRTGRHGKWERHQEFQGFASVDTDLYEEEEA